MQLRADLLAMTVLVLAVPGCRPPASPGDIDLAPDASYEVDTREIAEGLVYRKLYSGADSQRIHVVIADLGRPALRLDAETSNDSLLGFERTSEIFARLMAGGEKPLVAINADFWHRDGAPVGMFVDDGQVWRGPWYGSADGAAVTRSVFAFNRRNDVALGLPAYDLTLSLPGGSSIEVRDVNLTETEGRSRVFTDRYPMTIPVTAGWEYLSFTARDSAWIPNDPLRLEYAGSLDESRTVAAGEVVVALPESLAQRVGPAAQGEFLLRARLGNLDTPVDGVLGSLPRLIDRSGDSSMVDPVRFAVEEGIRPGFVTDRHPRTAVGYDMDRNWLYMVVVDGRSESAVGIDLVSLARLFREWGCELALNFDGGGSTTMVIGGEVVNQPSDQTGERPVSNVLVVRER